MRAPNQVGNRIRPGIWRMKRFIKSAIIALGLTLLSVGSGVTWYALSSPAVEDLPLSPELIAISSPEGQRLLVTSESKEDFSQLSPHMVGQIRRAFCGPATAAALVNAGLRPQPPVTQAMLFNPAATAVKGELALSFGGLTLAELAAFLGAHGLQAEREQGQEGQSRSGHHVLLCHTGFRRASTRPARRRRRRADSCAGRRPPG